MSGGCKFALGNFERKQITQKSRYGAENWFREGIWQNFLFQKASATDFDFGGKS
jgi:hypothetical protein